MFEPVVVLAVVAALALCANCAPLKSGRSAAGEGKFEVNNSSIYEQSGEFSLLDEVVYPERDFKPFDSRINVPNKLLTLGGENTRGRCNRCHECGFPAAWDTPDYGTPEWHPRYRGEQWRPVVQRMRQLDNSLINETIADRIYSFLHDESLGIYDAAKDSGPQVVMEIDPEELKPAIPRRPGERP